MGLYDEMHRENARKREILSAALVRAGSYRTHHVRAPKLGLWSLRAERPNPAKEGQWQYVSVRGWVIGDACDYGEEYDGRFTSVVIYLDESGWYLATIEDGPKETESEWEGNLFSSFESSGPCKTGEELRSWLTTHCDSKAAVAEVLERACRAFRPLISSGSPLEA
jgi:hypothetical protein